MMPAILCYMLDTQTRPEGLVDDTANGPYPRLTPTAVERAKTLLGITEIGELAEALGFSRMNFWRVRRGLYDIRYSHARRVADQLNMPLDQVFHGGAR